MAQVIEHLSSKHGSPEFKPPYHQNKRDSTELAEWLKWKSTCQAKGGPEFNPQTTHSKRDSTKTHILLLVFTWK
jgi:hypothetical protein